MSRLLVGMKCVKREIVQLAHPKSVGIIRIGGKKVSSDVLRTIYIYFMAYVGILIGSVVLVSLDNFDFETNVQCSTYYTWKCRTGYGAGRTDGEFCRVLTALKINIYALTCWRDVWRYSRSWYCLQHRRGAENSRITGGFFSCRLIFYI